MAAKTGGRVDTIADRYDISRRTVYRLVSQVQMRRNGKGQLDERGWADVEELVLKRLLRREAMRLLTEEQDLSRQAARRRGSGGSCGEATMYPPNRYSILVALRCASQCQPGRPRFPIPEIADIGGWPRAGYRGL